MDIIIYRKKLKKGESVDIFQGFRIPPVWDTRYTENKAIKKILYGKHSRCGK